MMVSRKSSPARERVFMTLLAMADEGGIIERFRRDEALDLAFTPSAEFERELDALITEGAVSELDRAGRSARRFTIRDRARRAEALAYLNANQATVTAIAAARTRIEPGRALTAPPAEAPASGPPVRIVRVVPLRRTEGGERFSLTVQVGGIGTIYGFVLQEQSRGPILFPPNRRVADNWEKIVDPVPAFTEALLALAVEAVAAHRVREGEPARTDAG
jgi:hypothetical protein